MSQIEYEIFREAAGNSPLDMSKTQIGFKVTENGDVVDSYSLSVDELKEHIKKREIEGEDTTVFRQALHEATS